MRRRRCAQHMYDTDTKYDAGKRCMPVILDFHAQQRRLAAKTHRADAHLIGFVGEAVFQLGQFGIGVGVFHLAEEHFLRSIVRRTTITPDGYTQHAGRTALSLRLLHRIEDDLAHAC